MELNQQEVKTPPRPAATVMLLRDGSAGPEVFMMRRHGNSDVLGGAYVFPGGKVDEDDHADEVIERLDSDVDTLHGRLADPGLEPLRAAGYFVAAARETFEECGVLFAEGADETIARAATTRAREGFSFVELLQQMDLRLSLKALTPWARWVTPRVPSSYNKRFDTRFFVAHAPSDQIARHDDRETTEGIWVQPRAALERYWAREIELAPPQIMTLAHFARLPDVAAIMAEAGRRSPPHVEPEPILIEGGRMVAYPGDPLHPIREIAIPGPTRLTWRGGRFEPLEGGFEAFFRD
jgi:8-oxo-dGTP pyrophosphatase MutT (NUDIX family)